jgi:hypothetical protein
MTFEVPIRRSSTSRTWPTNLSATKFRHYGVAEFWKVRKFGVYLELGWRVHYSSQVRKILYRLDLWCLYLRRVPSSTFGTLRKLLNSLGLQS